MTVVRRSNEITLTDLCTAAVYVMETVMREALESLKNDPETALEPIIIGERRKRALRIDASAEEAFGKNLRRYQNKRFSAVEIHGEEALRKPDLDLTNRKGVVALVDAIDGTDLLERGLSNWCSACVFFNPSLGRGRRILASFVGLPSGEIYYATSESTTAYVSRRRQRRQTSGPSTARSLKEASLCFYGQKAERLLSLAEHSLLRSLKSQGKKEQGFRVYNLAGNPMMVKMVDHRVKVAHSIDVVLDVNGQKPHDVIPGAFIAKKSGAIMTDLAGNEISYEALENALLRPSAAELTYILSSTRALSKEISGLLDSRCRERSSRVWNALRKHR